MERTYSRRRGKGNLKPFNSQLRMENCSDYPAKQLMGLALNMEKCNLRAMAEPFLALHIQIIDVILAGRPG
jgi:hypothetical protein